MTRFLIVLAFVFAPLAFTGTAVADDIGVGKPSSSTASTEQTLTAQDDIGVGEENWYDLLIGWFESE